MKKKTTIVTKTSFGYHHRCIRSTPKWLARNLYDITFYCWDYDEPKIALEWREHYLLQSEGEFDQKKSRFRLGLPQTSCGSPSIWFFWSTTSALSLAHLAGRNKVLICGCSERQPCTAPLLRRLLLDTIHPIELWTFRHRTVSHTMWPSAYKSTFYHLLPLGLILYILLRNNGRWV